MRIHRRDSQGVILVITLIMLSVVTLMAVLFLSLSRRERVAVSVTTDQITAEIMVDAALARAQSEIAGRMDFSGNAFNYDLMVSTNYLRYVPDLETDVFDESILGFDPRNVSYHADGFHGPLDQDLQAINIGNLLYDPRPPVYSDLNDPRLYGPRFRYFLDFNRNGRFEPSGWLSERYSRLGVVSSRDGTPLRTRLVGDPQWIGVLEHPGLPHSPTNRFVGRFAYLVVPEGKALDLNRIHNRASVPRRSRRIYNRNQGVGAWEMNLASFLTDLNYSYWGEGGHARNDADMLVNYRVRSDEMPSLEDERRVGGEALDYFGRDGVDYMTDGPEDPINSEPIPLVDNDSIVDPFWGSEPPYMFPDALELFPRLALGPHVDSSIHGDLISFGDFKSNLNDLGNSWNTYDRYTIYRLLSQMGMDSAPSAEATVPMLSVLDGLEPLSLEKRVPKINLNYRPVEVDVEGRIVYERWEPRRFFLEAADRLFQAQAQTNPPPLAFADPLTGEPVSHPGTNYIVLGDTYMTNHNAFAGTTLFSIRDVGIQVWPAANPHRKQYSANIHQILQQAANIGDVVAARPSVNELVEFVPGQPRHFPLVFRPRFSQGMTNGTVRIVDYVEVTNDAPRQLQRPWRDLDLLEDRTNLHPDDNVWGIPWVVSVRKGIPNFNEFGVMTTVEMTRKLEIDKGSAGAPPTMWQTNQMITLSISNLFGLEYWNAYRDEFSRNIQIHTLVDCSLVLTNQRQATLLSNRFVLPSRMQLGGGMESWGGKEFKIPFYSNDTALVLEHAGRMVRAPSAVYNHAQGRLIPVAGDLSDNVDRFFPDQPGFPMEALGVNLTNRIRALIMDMESGRILDFVNLDNLDQHLDLTQEMLGDVEGLAGVSELGEYWSNDRLGSTHPLAPPLGVLKQIVTSLGDLPVSSTVWNSFVGRGAGRDREEAIDLFRTFLEYPPRYLSAYELNDAYRRLKDPRKSVRRQVPFSPSVRKHIYYTLQANDPLVHYTEEDLRDPVGLVSQKRFAVPGQDVPMEDLHGFGPDDGYGRPTGAVNQRYDPWPGQINGEPPERYNMAHKDPLVRSADDWQFPTNNFASVGQLGQIHRGTPWQTIYLKAYVGTTGEEVSDADGRNTRLRMVTVQDLPRINPGTEGDSYPFRTMAMEDPWDPGQEPSPVPVDGNLLPEALDRWYEWSGSYGTHPTNDWKIPGLFTAVLHEDHSRGLLSVNQPGLAAWSAALSGVRVLTPQDPLQVYARNLHGSQPPLFDTAEIEPALGDGLPRSRFNGADAPLVRIVEGERGINATRLRFDGGRFPSLGDVLATPALTVESPYLDWTNGTIWQGGLDDRAVERIPQQILSLLKDDEPRVTIYAYGQALKPAEGSLRTDPVPERLFNICTNYQVTAEFALKRVVRFDGGPHDLKAVVESEVVLPSD